MADGFSASALSAAAAGASKVGGGPGGGAGGGIGTPIVQAPSESILEEPAAAQPEAALQECAPPEAGTRSARVRSLIASMATRVSMSPATSTPEMAARGYWINRPFIWATRNHQAVARYPGGPCFGIATTAFDYVEVAPPFRHPSRVTPWRNLAPAFDADMRWQAWPCATLPRRALQVNPMLEATLQATSDAYGLWTQQVRARSAAYVGEVSVLLAEYYKTQGIKKGSSAFTPLARLLGYMASINLPADAGLHSTASIPAESPLQVGAVYQAGSNLAVPVAQVGVISGWLISLRTFMYWRTARIAGPPGFTWADVGYNLLLVPVSISDLPEEAVNTWEVVVRMYYPQRMIYREGTARDPNGDLQYQDARQRWVDYTPAWYPTSTLVTVEGPGVPDVRQAGDRLGVVFVLTGDAPDMAMAPARVRTLSMLGGVQVALADGAFPAAGAPDLMPAITALWGGDLVRHNPALYQLQGKLIQYANASDDLHDVTMFWQAAIPVARWLPEWKDRAHRAAFVAPQGAAGRDWVSRAEYARHTPEVAVSIISLPTNSLAQWPGVAIDPGLARFNPQTGSVHWEVPLFDQEYAVMQMAGVLSRVDASSPQSVAVSALDWPAWIMAAGLCSMAAVDMVLASTGVSRQVLWYDVAQDQYATVVREVDRLREAQSLFWGRPNFPPARANVSMSCAAGELYFGHRIKVWYPTNGVLLDTTQNPGALIAAACGAGLVGLARIDLPTLDVLAGVDTYELPTVPERDLTSLGWSQARRNRLTGAYDLIAPLPDARGGGSGGEGAAWSLRSQLDGLGANGWDWQLWDSLFVTFPAAEWERFHLSLLAASPMTWASLASVEDWAGVVADTNFVPSGWSLSVERPLPGWAESRQCLLSVGTTAREVVYTPHRYAASRPTYTRPTGSSRWDTTNPMAGDQPWADRLSVRI